MVTVLIVDDEKTTRTALETHVPWDNLGVSVLGTARNGLEALELMEQNPADLILCDVRMPKMDGIALATALRERWPDCAIIFLSGYSDKEYLKTAIRVQAAAYIDKPLNIPEISAQVRAVTSAINARRAEQASLEPLRRRRLAEDLLTGQPEASSRALAEFPWLNGPLRVGILQAISPDSRDGGRQDIPAILAWLNTGAPSRPSILAGQTAKGQLAMVGGSILAGDEQACILLVEELSASQTCPVRAAFSGPLPGITGLAGGLDLAGSALDQAFYHPTERCLFHRPRQDRRFQLAPDLPERLAAALTKGDLAAARLWLGQAGEQAAGVEDPDIPRLRGDFLALLAPLARLVPGWTAAEATPEQVRLERELDTSPDLGALIARAGTWIERLFAPAGDSGQGQRRIERALAFIRQQASDPDLNVERIASHLSLSEAYLCTVFKEETGSTVKEAVTRVRMERARDLLATSEDKLQAVALAVGFRDTNYFCTVFKRETGVTPGEFRERSRR